MPEPDGATQAPTRAGRCANHPDTPKAADCDLCGRPLCLSCAIPVRGRVVGPECVGTLVQDAPEEALRPPSLPPRRGDVSALVGFGLVLVVSVFPWSRFGDASRFLGAWSLHWSLWCVTAALIGLTAALVSRRRPIEPVVVGAAYVVLGALVVVAAILQQRHPPLLSEATVWPMVAVLGGLAAVVGGFQRVAAMLGAVRAR